MLALLLLQRGKIRGTFITMPTKGCSDAFHDSKGCLVRLIVMPTIPP